MTQPVSPTLTSLAHMKNPFLHHKSGMKEYFLRRVVKRTSRRILEKLTNYGTGQTYQINGCEVTAGFEDREHRAGVPI